MFANITTVVAFMSQGNHIEFFRNYNEIVKKIGSGSVEKKTIDSVCNYFNFMWDLNQGVIFEEIADFLPPSMSSKLCINHYANAIENSLLFINNEGKLTVPLIISLFKRIKLKTYRSSDIVVKIGEQTENTIFLIEGELKVFGHCRNEMLGILTQGSHFGLDLSENVHERK